MHLALLLGLVAPTRAATFDGRWVIDTPEADIQREQDAGLDRALASIAAPVRSAAAAVLRRSMAWCAGYELQITATDLHLACDARPAVDARFGDAPAPMALGSGTVQLTAAWEGAAGAGAVHVRLASEDGARESRLRLEGDALVVTVTVESPRFDAPIAWTVRYRRP